MAMKMGKREANVREKLRRLEILDTVFGEGARRHRRAHRKFRAGVEAALAQLDHDEKETAAWWDTAWEGIFDPR